MSYFKDTDSIYRILKTQKAMCPWKIIESYHTLYTNTLNQMKLSATMSKKKKNLHLISQQLLNFLNSW